MDEEILESPLSPNSLSIDNLEKEDDLGNLSIHRACYQGKINICKDLADTGIKLNSKNPIGTTPLMLAVDRGHGEIVEFLISKKVDVADCNFLGATTVAIACAQNDVHLINTLLKNDDSKMELLNEKCLSLIVCSGSLDVLKLIYDLDKDLIHQPVTTGLTSLKTVNLLELAEFSNQTEVVSQLKKWGVKKPIERIDILTLPLPPLSLLSPVDSKSLLQVPSAETPKESSTFTFSPIKKVSPMKHFLKTPLTPNLCFSPFKKKPGKRSRAANWFPFFKRRSKSQDRITELKKPEEDKNLNYENLLKYILASANMNDEWNLLENHEVSFKTFLTLTEENLLEVGIKKSSTRKKMITLIEHYKRIFYVFC